MPSRPYRDRDRPPNLSVENYVSGQVYRDEAVFQDELDRVLGKVWHFACHASEIPEPGDRRSVQHALQPLVVRRGADGGATCMAGTRAIRTEIKHGLVFVNLDDNAVSLDAFLGNSLEIFDDVFGDPAVEYEVFHFHRGTVNANWKAWQETIVDLYHEFMHIVLRTTQMTAAPMAARDMRVYPNGHLAIGGLKADYNNYKAYGTRDDSAAFPGLTVNDARFTPLFPDTTIITRGTVMRIDTVTPLGPHRTIVESRGLGIRGESAADRRMRIRHHNDYWGPFGRNVPEDAFAAEACEKAFGNGAARYQIIARDEDGQGQDDLMLRAYYKAWSDMTGRPAHSPANS